MRLSCLFSACCGSLCRGSPRCGSPAAVALLPPYRQRGAAWWWWLLILAVLAAGGYWYWLGSKAEQAQQAEAQRETAAVQRGDIEETVLATGQVQAFTEVSAGAQASGQISELLVQVGDAVEKGQVIARIDPSTQRNELRDVQAQQKSHQASVGSQQVSLQQAQRDLERQQMMYAEGATSLQALEQAQVQVQTAAAALQQAKVQLEQSRLKVKKARLNMGYTTVLSPISGTVVSLAVDEGQTLNAVQSSPVIATIAQLEKMKVKLEISEADVSKVQPGQAAYFTVLGNTQRRHPATVQSIDPAPTAVSNNANARVASGTPVYYYGTLVVPNADGVLRMYMTANAVITVAAAKDVLVLPARALRDVDTAQQTATVQLLSGQAEQEHNGTTAAGVALTTQTVTTGLNNGVQVEIRSGLKAGDLVVLPMPPAAADEKQEGGLFG